MKYLHQFKIVVLTVVLVLPLIGFAQFQVEGSYRFRIYNDQFSGALDDRGNENYIRHLARIKGTLNLNKKTKFVTEVIGFTESNSISDARNIGGTGPMYYGLSKVYVEFYEPNVAFIDMLRVRVGRQQFQLGKGLTQGESFYYTNNFDAARLDLDIKGYKLTLFGSITEQNVSSSGLYPDPGSDQIYIARLTKEVFKHDLMAYCLYNKLRGDFNDSYILGGGISAKILDNNLEYFGEFAYQKFNTIDGLPSKHGIGYMGGVSYMFKDISIFKNIKIETRYAAYQGDDATTADYEQFSPLFPSFTWGDRRGWVNGFLGGVYPHNGQYTEGSRIWFSRIYFVPEFLPSIRLQFQYLDISEYVNNDGYDEMFNEFAVKLFYRLSRQSELQVRYVVNKSKEDDFDLDGNGSISWSEDRVDYTRLMIGLNFKF